MRDTEPGPPFEPGLLPGQIISNAELMAIFHCACEGGIRPANRTHSIVLVLNHVKMDHSGDWHGGILWFRGAGSKGDQTLEKGRNRTLLNGLKGERPVYLFEVFSPGAYTYRGRVALTGEPFQQSDSGDPDRKVWIFPLTEKEGA